ncbi:hypothetical protein AVBRAN9333_08455 [Campylobacter sp. RM9333]|uniref:DUF7210 family protein n=1 Tax=Campylobacter sp. RM9333 TaxID=2735731 RepID=UPI001DDA6535|nr:hypothetical protein [Campylobacter sp. RM9333]
MKKYEVLVSFYYEKKTYPVGDNIELSEQDAKQLLRSNYIKELYETTKQAKKESKKQTEPKSNDEPKADEPSDLGEEQKVDEPNEEPKPEEQKADKKGK